MWGPCEAATVGPRAPLMLTFGSMTPRVVVSVFLGIGLVLASAPGVAAATPRAALDVPAVAVPAWFAGLHLNSGQPVIKNQCPNR